MHTIVDLFIERDTRAEARELPPHANTPASLVRVGYVNIFINGPKELAEAIANAINAAAKHDRALYLQKRRK